MQFPRENRLLRVLSAPGRDPHVLSEIIEPASRTSVRRAQVCTVVSTGVHRCAQVCTGARQLCTTVHNCVQLCTCSRCEHLEVANVTRRTTFCANSTLVRNICMNVRRWLAGKLVGVLLRSPQTSRAGGACSPRPDRSALRLLLT